MVEGEPLMENQQSEGSVQLRIVRGSLGSLSLYEITDYELELLEAGSPSSTYLNFAIMFVSVGLSFLATLLTVKIPVGYAFTIFVVLTVVGFAASAVLFELWRRTRSRTVDLCKKIRARVPTAPISGVEEATVVSDSQTESDS
jgi:hypothetical protein